MEKQGDILTVPIEELVQSIKTILKQGGNYRLYVTGYSMSPTLRPYTDSVELKSANIAHIKKGDILFVKRDGGGYMLHRVCKVERGGGFCLNGDGQQWKEKVSKENVIAVVTGIYREERYISVKKASYRIYVAMWQRTRPFRNILIAIKNRFRK